MDLDVPQKRALRTPLLAPIRRQGDADIRKEGKNAAPECRGGEWDFSFTSRIELPISRAPADPMSLRSAANAGWV
jgi:hypothetical protein